MPQQIKKKPHSAEFKFKVALEAARGERTVAELCQEYGVVSSQIFKWKKALLEHGSEIFSKGTPIKSSSDMELEKLHATIGRLKVENDFLSKFAGRHR
jgi:transposase-like protein